MPNTVGNSFIGKTDAYFTTLKPPDYYNPQTHTLAPALELAEAATKESWVQKLDAFPGTKAPSTAHTQSWARSSMVPERVKTDRKVFGWPDPKFA